MDDLLQKETERQRRLLEEARKAVEQEKARLREGGARRVEPRLDESPPQQLQGIAASESRAEPALRTSDVQQARPQQRTEPLSATSFERSDGAVRTRSDDVVRLRCIPDMRSALIPLDDGTDGAAWSKPFSLPRADMEPWLSYLRGYRQSCLFPDAASAGHQPRVDAAVQALLELKGIGLKVILEPAVQINGPVEYFDEQPLDAPGEVDVHEAQLAKAVVKGREMGDHLYDALLGEGYVNLVQAWEKVHNRKPNVSELHFMLTTGRVKPPVEIQPLRPEIPESAPQPTVTTADSAQKRVDEVLGRKKEKKRLMAGLLGRLPRIRFFSALEEKFENADKRKFLFHLSHLLLVGASIVVYCVVMRVFE